MRRFATALWVLLCALLGACVTGTRPAPADLVFTGGAVYTVNPQQPWASAVAIRDGRIIYVGDDEGARRWIGAATSVEPLEGRMLMPGFEDSHMHPMSAGTRFARCQLKGKQWPAEVLAEVARCAAELSAGEWLRAVDLGADAFTSGGPYAALLDTVSPDNPVILQADDGNYFLVNSMALELAGIDPDTVDPPGGRIGRMPGGKDPSGMLGGDAAGPVYEVLPVASIPTLLGGLAYASGLANRLGITSTNEARTAPDMVEAYLEAEAKGMLKLRVQASLQWNPERGLEQIADLEAERREANGGRFIARSVKMFLDGDGQYRSGALLEPYAGTTEAFGRLNFSDAQIREIVSALDARGFDLHFHAWGDAAVRQALDALEYATEVNPPRDRRHQVAHLELVDANDLERFRKLNVTADVHPIWAWMSKERNRELANLGEERAARAVPIASLFDAGARVVLGTDWISESMDPLVTLQYAITRRPLDGSAPAWNPQERITLAQAIEAYTINGAWLARQENETGSIEVGKAADLVVLDHNLFELDPMEISRAKILLTLLEGREVYRAKD